MTTIDTLEVLVKLKDTATAGLVRVQKSVGAVTKSVQGSMMQMHAAVEKNKSAFYSLGGAAGGALMSLAKSSAMATAITEEFESVLSYVGDTIMMNLMPVLEPLLDILWDFADWFANAPPWLQTLVSLLTLMAFGFTTLIGLVGFFGPMFVQGWKLVSGAVTAFSAHWDDFLFAMQKGWMKLGGYFDSFKTWLGDTFVPAIKGGLSAIHGFFTETLVPALKSGWETIAGAAGSAKTFIMDHFVTPITDALSGLKTWFSETFIPALGAGWRNMTSWVSRHKTALTAMAGAAAAAFFIYMAFTSESPKMKAAFSIMAGVMAVLAASTWLATVAAVSLASALTFGIAIAAIVAGVTFGLSMLFGAKKDAETEFDMETPPEEFEADIPGFAEGGIVRGPTLAMIGEAGPEAVVPLDRLPSGNNTTVSVNIDLSGATIMDDVKLKSALRDATDSMVSELTRRGVIARPY